MHVVLYGTNVIIYSINICSNLNYFSYLILGVFSSPSGRWDTLDPHEKVGEVSIY